MNVIGLDLSLVGTAAVAVDVSTGKVTKALAYVTRAGKLKGNPFPDWMQLTLGPGVENGDPEMSWRRTVEVSENVLAFVALQKPSHVALEDHAFNAQGSSIYQLAHLHGLIRRGLELGGIEYQGPRVPFRLYTPQAIKGCATGKGNADKTMMVIAAEKEGVPASSFGEPVCHNLADAFWCAQLLRAEVLVRMGRVRPIDLSRRLQDVLNKRTEKRAPLLEQAFLGSAS